MLTQVLLGGCIIMVFLGCTLFFQTMDGYCRDPQIEEGIYNIYEFFSPVPVQMVFENYAKASTIKIVNDKNQDIPFSVSELTISNKTELMADITNRFYVHVSLTNQDMK